MVTKPDRPNPPGPTGLKKLKPVQPAAPVAGFAAIPTPPPGPLYRDGAPPEKFKLPEKVTPAEIKEQSYRYGGGRRAGKLGTEP